MDSKFQQDRLKLGLVSVAFCECVRIFPGCSCLGPSADGRGPSETRNGGRGTTPSEVIHAMEPDLERNQVSGTSLATSNSYADGFGLKNDQMSHPYADGLRPK
jgi:hypothetical protein